MAQTLTRLLVHVIFSTKLRENLIADDIEQELYRYMGGICRNIESPLLAAGGTANHVHLLVSLSKKRALADLLMQVKKDSSAWIKPKRPRMAAFQWQEGYGAFTIGQSQVESVRAYLARQKEHHRQVTFEEEFRTFLVKYDVPYDERYVWR